tara:strand:+ start:450 stop:935 length:486 start_codon:yes stop_codon:yes gene_type:complete
MTKSISLTSTLKDLIALGLIKSSQLDSWNKRLARKTEKTLENIDQTRANQAVAFYLGCTYPNAPVEDNSELHDRRAEAVDFKNGKSRFSFGLKPTEKALLKYGISRRMIEIAFAQLREEDVMISTKGIVSNNAHVRHAILRAPARDLESRPLEIIETDSPE